ncbi:saposin-like type B, region 1 family protein precursor [Zea mays]|uniref:Saposin B domain-containing protein n=1 Tax=Zea mays TaxID=4577 RepID=B4FYV4_MAIZE|nr:saposin-like type B, region 1 family protein precursor [Zea mays]ACF87297.1 unknown [Zea mays]AQK93964.1 saposin B domain-containing protein [Zea mays]
MDTGAQAMFIISLVLWCTTSFALDDAAATRIPIVGTLPLSMKENPQLCQLCEEFASEALFYLNENETQTEIIDTLHQACSKFGSFKLECTRLVDYYVPLFFTKIASLSPEEFCASASFCGGVTFIRLPRHEDTCTLCHEVVDEVVTNLEDPGMELKIIEILLKGCNNAEDYVQKCKRLIIQNAPIIMENIKKFLEKRDFCNSIHVCGSKSVRAGSQVLRSLSSA